MSRPDPHHRALLAIDVVDGRAQSKDSAVLALVKVIQGKSKDTALMYAWDKFREPLECTVIESFLLADATYENINKATFVPVEVLQAYADYIFDTSVFRDLLERTSYVSRCRGYLPRDQQAFLEAALSRGWEYVSWLLNHPTEQTPKSVLTSAMSEGYFMGLAHRGVDPTTERAKQSRAWLQSAVQAATTLIRSDPTESDEDILATLKLVLAHHNDVINADTKEAPLKEDIVH